MLIAYWRRRSSAVLSSIFVCVGDAVTRRESAGGRGETFRSDESSKISIDAETEKTVPVSILTGRTHSSPRPGSIDVHPDPYEQHAEEVGKRPFKDVIR